MLDPEDRRLHVLRARPRQQHDQQLGARALDPHRLLDSERPDSRRGARDDPVCGEALRARVRLYGERLSGEQGKRREHPGGVAVATRLIASTTAEATSGGTSGCSSGIEQGGREMLQLGRVLERRRVLEQREELRDDLFVQDV